MYYSQFVHICCTDGLFFPSSFQHSVSTRCVTFTCQGDGFCGDRDALGLCPPRSSRVALLRSSRIGGPQDLMSRSKRAPYVGDTRKLVVSIDVGTTFTAASFCILTPGEVPQFVEVRICKPICVSIHC
jgi:hypothetical protein